MNVIINLIINFYLTFFRKEVYYEIHKVFKEVEIFINNEISISWKFSLLTFYY